MACLSMDHMSEPSTPNFTQQDAPPSGPLPSPFSQYGHALPTSATSAGELFLFGGLVDSACNDLYVFSMRDLSATLWQTSGEIPSPCVRHVVCSYRSLQA